MFMWTRKTYFSGFTGSALSLSRLRFAGTEGLAVNFSGITSDGLCEDTFMGTGGTVKVNDAFFSIAVPVSGFFDELEADC